MPTPSRPAARPPRAAGPLRTPPRRRRPKRTPPRRPPDRPTAARPGTKEKVAELARRYAKGLALWHPGDAPLLDDDTFRTMVHAGNYKPLDWLYRDEREYRRSLPADDDDPAD